MLYRLFVTSPNAILTATFDTDSSAISPPASVIAADRPNFFALHPSAPILYATTDAKGGSVEAFTINHQAPYLTPLARQSSAGEHPCHLAIHPSASLLALANYLGATVAALPLSADGHPQPATSTHHHTGSSIHPRRQNKPYPHGVAFTSTGQHLYVCDLGIDSVVLYNVDPTRASMTAADTTTKLPPGSGPRHLALSRDDRFAYVINELTSTVAAFSRAPDGSLAHLQTVSPWDNSREHTGSEVQLHPNGKFLYASNRGHDQIAVFSIHPSTGQLTLVSTHSTAGKTPRHFALDPTGQFLLAANQDSHSLVPFHIDAGTGRLIPTGMQIQTDSPICVVFASIP